MQSGGETKARNWDYNSLSIPPGFSPKRMYSRESSCALESTSAVR